MIKAKEAQKMTDNSFFTIIGNIEAGIKKSAEIGKYHYEHIVKADSSIVYQVLDKLKDCGFTVEEHNEIGYDCEWRTRISVSWEKEPDTTHIETKEVQ